MGFNKRRNKVKKLLLSFILTIAVCVCTSNVWAQPFSVPMGSDSYGTAQGGGNLPIPTPRDNNDGTPDINDAINFLLGSSLTRNSDADFLQVTPDATWQDLSPTDSTGVFTIIGLTAAASNTLGVYRTADGIHLPLLGPFSGAGFMVSPFPAVKSPLAGGENFGFYIDSLRDSITTTYDSNPLNNLGGYDHMLTYHLAGLAGQTLTINLCDAGGVNCSVIVYKFNDPYLIAWEDKPCVDNGSGVVTCGDEDFDDILYLVDRVHPVPEPISMMLFGSGLLGLAGARLRKRIV